MEKWTYNDVPTQEGRIALVTGANTGIGLQTALMLAKKGTEVILACRDLTKAEKAINEIKQEVPAAKVSYIKLDVSDLDSVAECAEKIKAQHSRLDLLINNAGVMIPPFSRTAQGFELQFGTNHLGHFALTGLLLPLMTNTPNSRIVSVSSIAAKINYMDFNDLNFEHKRYKKWFAYGQSKLANQMFIFELARKLEKSGAQTKAVAVHPGLSTTNLFKNSGFLMRKVLMSILSHSPQEAALSFLRAACDPQAENGSYWGPSRFFECIGAPQAATKTTKAKKLQLTEKLWKMSEELTGVVYQL